MMIIILVQSIFNASITSVITRYKGEVDQGSRRYKQDLCVCENYKETFPGSIVNGIFMVHSYLNNLTVRDKLHIKNFQIDTKKELSTNINRNLVQLLAINFP